jgi:biotin carboxyl carrier protein
MRHYRITLEGHTFDIEILDDPRQEQVRVQVDGEILTVGVEAGLAGAEAAATGPDPAVAPTVVEPPPAPASTASALADHVLRAPLPGVVKSIAVRPGQPVAVNDELLVIEAMKMDNVIRAPRGGTIAAIHVAEGRQVAYGERLLDFADRAKGR